MSNSGSDGQILDSILHKCLFILFVIIQLLSLATQMCVLGEGEWMGVLKVSISNKVETYPSPPLAESLFAVR